MSGAGERPPLLDETWLATVRDRMATASGLLVCLDFDGTLAPIVDDPDDAKIYEPNGDLLRRLAAIEDVVVVIVSGRSLSDLRERIGLDDVHLAGNHGFEWDYGVGRTVAGSVRERQSAIAAAVDRLERELDDVPGCRVEDKDLTATVHYRQTPADAVSTVTERVRDVAESTGGIRCSPGKCILELRPDVPAGKDRVVAHLRDRYPDYLPLFVGDDVTDEDGFTAVAEGGFGVLVGDRTDSAAAVRVPDLDGVTMLLGWLVQTVARGPGSSAP